MKLTDKIFTDENAAREHLEALRWANGCSCPLCGGLYKIKPVKMMSKPSEKKPESVEVKGFYHCGDCRRKFTVRTGTVYERSHIALNLWVLATHLLCSSKKGMSAHQLHRMLGVTYKTAWFMAHRIREAMIETPTGPMGGSGKSVQADETYIGKKKVQPTTRTDGKPFMYGKPKGMGTKNAVVSLLSEGKTRSFHVDRADADTVRNILVTNASRDSQLVTDESRLYTKVGKEYADHQTVNHGKNEYVRFDGLTTNHIENFFSIFKRGMIGTYQHCSEKHLGRYLSEFDFRYNSRDVDDFTRAVQAMKGAEGKRITYRRIGERRAT
jgi:transposase-like protein